MTEGTSLINKGNGKACITLVETCEYLEKTINTEYCYDRENKNLLMSVTDDGEIVKYVYGNGLISSYTEAEKEVSYREGEYGKKFYTYDLRGSVTFITDEEGSVECEYSYSAYGTRTVVNGYESVLGYCARDGVLTENGGLCYMRARYYSPELQRFVNQDIVVGDISNSNSLNRYTYVEGNPATMVDPFGLDAQKPNTNGNSL